LYGLNSSGSIHLTPSILNDKYIIRFCVDAQNATEEDISIAWEFIKSQTDELFENYSDKCELITKSDKLIEFDSLVDMTKLRRQCFSRMVSDPIGMKSDSNDESSDNYITPYERLKRRMSRFKTVQFYSDDKINETNEQQII
jgi:hypothetical protein